MASNIGLAVIDDTPGSAQQASMPPTLSDQGTFDFPSSTAMQDHSVASSVSSDWGGSRSSSVSTYNHEPLVAQSMATPQSQPQIASTSSQWQPGQSVPVDFNQLSQEFRQIAQSRQPQQQYSQEQPLAWPLDEAYHERQNSQTASITQSMGNVGLKTPQPQQHATFKSPTPGATSPSYQVIQHDQRRCTGPHTENYPRFCAAIPNESYVRRCDGITQGHS